MRIKLDSSGSGLPEVIREDARNEFLKLYDKFPVQVVWIYLKRIRFMTLGCTVISIRGMLEDYELPAQHLHGFEDAIASCKSVHPHLDHPKISDFYTATSY
jgi:hypothetical protein